MPRELGIRGGQSEDYKNKQREKSFHQAFRLGVLCVVYGKSKRESPRLLVEETDDDGRDACPCVFGSCLEFENLYQKWELYPALRIWYATGMTAIVANDTKRLIHLLTQKIQRRRDIRRDIIQILYGENVLEKTFLNDAMGRTYTIPLSELLYQRLREPLRSFLPTDNDYTRCFDVFEYWQGLAYAALEPEVRDGRIWGPVGAFGYRYGRGQLPPFAAEITQEAERMGSAWPPFKVSLFDGSLERFHEIYQAFNKHIVEGRNWH